VTATPIRPCTAADLDAMYAVINDAAIAYRGAIPSDRWHEPYMPMRELHEEIDAGVRFWGMFEGTGLEAVMGLQHVADVALVRHAYTRTVSQGRGFGKALLHHVLGQTERPVLIGTWSAATWAIGFYESQGFTRVDRRATERLLKKYWSIPARQVEESVVLADARGMELAQSARAEACGAVDLAPMGKGADDFEFALTAKREALGPHIAERWGWNDALQRRQQAEGWDELQFFRIVAAGESVGAVSLEDAADHVKLIGFYILPAFQGRGIGEAVLARLIAESSAKGLPLRLRCLKWNPALSLYTRHGFIIAGETETHFLMERLPWLPRSRSSSPAPSSRP
jgi:ribosomal protein S18 acetylase RimI-like enzyme